MSLYRHVRRTLQDRVMRLRCRSIYRRFRSFTMVPEAGFVENLLLAQRVLPVSGCVVECGVWRGGMIAGLAMILGSDRDYLLFDSFQGLPPARPIDGVDALRWQGDVTSPGFHNNCTAESGFARRAMTLAGARSYRLIEGWFHETLPAFQLDGPIALLRLDGDWYDSTRVCLDHLFDHVAPGGLVILDDYPTWDGCSRAVHDFLSRHSARERIGQFGGTFFLAKRPPAGPPEAGPVRGASGTKESSI